MSDKTLDDVILEAVRPLSEVQKRQLLAYIEQLDDQDAAPTLAELLALPYDERNRRAKRAGVSAWGARAAAAGYCVGGVCVGPTLEYSGSPTRALERGDSHRRSPLLG